MTTSTAAAGSPAEPRVGVIGGGTMAREHLAAWRRLGVTASAYSPSGRGAAIAADHGAWPRTTLAELLGGCDVVDICSPTGTHRPLAEAAFGAGRDVICEKPLALTHHDAAAMIDAAHRYGRALQVAHVVRYFAGYAAARASIAQGDIGPVRELRLRRTGAAPTTAWFHDEAASGGVLMDQMIHDFDYARWVLGEVDTVTARTEERVDADGNRLVRASATLVHVGGTTSTLTGGWLSPAEPFTTCLTVIGDVGGIRHTNAADVLEVTREGSVVRVDLDDDRPYDGELLDLISAIATGATPRVTAADALAAVDLTLAARESAATGRPVTPRR